jgi:hypothetical protein
MEEGLARVFLIGFLAVGYAGQSLKVNGISFKKLSTESVNISVDNWLHVTVSKG